jgi:hypothetical protein
LRRKKKEKGDAREEDLKKLGANTNRIPHNS